MKKIGITFFCCCIILSLAFTFGCSPAKVEYLRIHIRANSNAVNDQSVKYEVRDAVVNYLTPIIENATSKEDAILKITNTQTAVKALIDGLLAKKGYKYKSKVSIKEELFPTRVYEGLTLEAGYYDAVIIELGEGSGDNWWCVVYPPLCFMGSEDITYRSKIWEIINGL